MIAYEIFATYMGLRFLPTEVRNIVKPMVKEALEKENWYMAYEAFTEACDTYPEGTPLDAAYVILDFVCRMIESIDINGANLLYNFSKIWTDDVDRFWTAALLEQAGVPPDVYWSVYKTYKELGKTVAAIDKDTLGNMKQSLLLQTYVFSTRISLFGRYSENYISIRVPDYVLKLDYGDNLSPPERVFYESVRQQLSKKCGFVCPGNCVRERRNPCNWTEMLQRVYDRLPEEKKKCFNRPE